MASESDLNSLISSGYWWELFEYISLAAVLIGVAVQSIHEFTRWFKHIPWWDRNGRRVSAFILIAASAAVLVTTIKVTSINDLAIAFLGDKEADSRLRAANLEKQAAELRSRAAILERTLGPRRLDGDVFLRILGNDPKGEFEILYAAEEQDARLLALSLRVLLVKAGWKFIDERPVSSAELLQSAVGFPMNVEVVVKNLDGDPIFLPPDKNTEPRTLYAVLSGAIIAALGMTRVEGREDASLPEGRARIIVFPRSGM